MDKNNKRQTKGLISRNILFCSSIITHVHTMGTQKNVHFPDRT